MKTPEDYVSLADWRRQIAELYRDVREQCARSPVEAHALWRRRRDELFGSHPQSALTLKTRARFGGLRYYEYDPRFALTATIRPCREDRYDVPASDGSTIRFVQIGSIDLLNGSLDVFWLDAYGGGIFLPFSDATCGSDTYGSGRYLLDTAKGADLGERDGSLVVDFNFAYHPSCAYDAKWICPLAPASNRLSVPVEAGEMLMDRGHDG